MNQDQENKNHLAIKETLDSLRERLGPMIEKIFAPAMQGESGTDGVADMHEAAEILRGKDLSELDSHTCLKLLTRVPAVYRNLNRLGLCHAHEMIAIRNLWAHDYKFSDSEVDRARDTTERLQGYLEHYFDEPPVREDAIQSQEDQYESPHVESELESQPDDSDESGSEPEMDEPSHETQPDGVARESGDSGEEDASGPDLFEPGQVLKGEIVGITNHGLMLNMNASRAYLVHKKNLGGMYIRDRSVLSEIYELGETIEVEVLSIDELGRPNLVPVSPRVPQDGGEPMPSSASHSDYGDSGESSRPRGRSSGYQGGDRSSGYQGGDRSSGYRGGGRSSGYQGGDRSSGYQGGGRSSGGYQGGGRSSGGYQGGGRSSGGYQGGDRNSGYQGGGRSSGYQGGDRSSGYQGGGRGSGYQGGDRSSGYQGGGRGSGGYQGGGRSSGYQGGDRQANGNDHRHRPDPDTPMPKTGEVVRGTVRGIYPRGASVSLDSGWGGYLHISNVSHEFVRNVDDYVAVGQGLELIVLDVDTDKRRINLGLKQIGKPRG